MDQGLGLVQTLDSGLECEMDYELFFFFGLSFELMWSFIMTEDHCLVQQKPCMVCILAHNIGREISDALVLSSQEE